MTDDTDLEQLAEYVWELPQEGGMNVPARVFASEEILELIRDDRTLEQARNICHFPGIHKYACVLPDAHQGYGMPVGGVIALDAENGGISPGAVGYDINCGVRVMTTSLTYDEVRGKEQQLANILFQKVPSGLGEGAVAGSLSTEEVEDICLNGVQWAVDNGYAVEDDMTHCEDEGFRDEAAVEHISDKAKNRASEQAGSLGSGNHFLEVQRVADIYDRETAEQYGLAEDQVVVTIHCGSRGLGHQICSDFLRRIEQQHQQELEQLPDKELAYAPAGSDLEEQYYEAMNAAINFAWVNRQLVMHQARKCFERIFDQTADEMEMRLLYDVAHNIAKKEEHTVEDGHREVYVH
ncbi:MAG: RtcB family protein, partial [Candidatus Nanohaloarchaea archaeon]|nr:RtcB family protein [Candidatus Nanohaloarchaea archaeon]